MTVRYIYKVILLLSALLPFCALAQNGPVLELDSLYLDLGHISADSIASGVMRFHNSGDSDLVIMRITPECGCTVPVFSSAPVAPGESGEIKVKFNGKGRRPGAFSKAVRIRTNAENPRSVFFVKGKIKRIYKE